MKDVTRSTLLLQRLTLCEATLLREVLSRSKQDAGKSDPQLEETPVQEETDTMESSIDPASDHQPLVDSPNTAKDIMTEVPDRSTGDSASTVNYLALEDGLESLPRPAVASNKGV